MDALSVKEEEMGTKVPLLLPSFPHLPARGVPTPVTEPFLAGVAVNHTGRVMDPTVTAIPREKQQVIGYLLGGKSKYKL